MSRWAELRTRNNVHCFSHVSKLSPNLSDAWSLKFLEKMHVFLRFFTDSQLFMASLLLNYWKRNILYLFIFHFLLPPSKFREERVLNLRQLLHTNTHMNIMVLVHCQWKIHGKSTKNVASVLRHFLRNIALFNKLAWSWIFAVFNKHKTAW